MDSPVGRSQTTPSKQRTGRGKHGQSPAVQPKHTSTPAKHAGTGTPGKHGTGTPSKSTGSKSPGASPQEMTLSPAARRNLESALVSCDSSLNTSLGMDSGVVPLTPAGKARVTEFENTTIVKQRQELQLLIAELRDRDRELNDMVTAHQKQIRAWDQDRKKILSLEEKCGHLEGSVHSRNDDVRQLMARLRVVESEEQNKSTALDSAQQQLTQLSEQNSQSFMQIEELQVKSRSLNDSVHDMNSNIGDLEAREQELIAVLQKKDRDLSDASSRIAELSAKLKRMDGQFHESQSQVSDLRRQVSTWKNKHIEAEREAEHLQRELAKAEHHSERQHLEVQKMKQEASTVRKELLLATEREKRKDQLLKLQKSKQERSDSELSDLRQLYERQQKDLSLLHLNLESTRELLAKQQNTFAADRSFLEEDLSRTSQRSLARRQSPSMHTPPRQTYKYRDTSYTSPNYTSLAEPGRPQYQSPGGATVPYQRHSDDTSFTLDGGERSRPHYGEGETYVGASSPLSLLSAAEAVHHQGHRYGYNRSSYQAASEPLLPKRITSPSVVAPSGESPKQQVALPGESPRQQVAPPGESPNQQTSPPGETKAHQPAVPLEANQEMEPPVIPRDDQASAHSTPENVPLVDDNSLRERRTHHSGSHRSSTTADPPNPVRETRLTTQSANVCQPSPRPHQETLPADHSSRSLSSSQRNSQPDRSAADGPTTRSDQPTRLEDVTDTRTMESAQKVASWQVHPQQDLADEHTNIPSGRVSGEPSLAGSDFSLVDSHQSQSVRSYDSLGVQSRDFQKAGGSHRPERVEDIDRSQHRSTHSHYESDRSHESERFRSHRSDEASWSRKSGGHESDVRSHHFNINAQGEKGVHPDTSRSHESMSHHSTQNHVSGSQHPDRSHDSVSQQSHRSMQSHESGSVKSRHSTGHARSHESMSQQGHESGGLQQRNSHGSHVSHESLDGQGHQSIHDSGHLQSNTSNGGHIRSHESLNHQSFQSHESLGPRNLDSNQSIRSHESFDHKSHESLENQSHHSSRSHESLGPRNLQSNQSIRSHESLDHQSHHSTKSHESFGPRNLQSDQSIRSHESLEHQSHHSSRSHESFGPRNLDSNQSIRNHESLDLQSHHSIQSHESFGPRNLHSDQSIRSHESLEHQSHHSSRTHESLGPRNIQSDQSIRSHESLEHQSHYSIQSHESLGRRNLDSDHSVKGSHESPSQIFGTGPLQLTQYKGREGDSLGQSAEGALTEGTLMGPGMQTGSYGQPEVRIGEDRASTPVSVGRGHNGVPLDRELESPATKLHILLSESQQLARDLQRSSLANHSHDLNQSACRDDVSRPGPTNGQAGHSVANPEPGHVDAELDFANTSKAFELSIVADDQDQQ